MLIGTARYHTSACAFGMSTDWSCFLMQGMTTVKLPLTAFRASGLGWASDGSAVLLRDLDRYVVAFAEPEGQPLRPEP